MKKKLVLAFVYLLLAIISFLHVIPAIWVFMSSFKPGEGLFSPTFFPRSFTLDHYVNLFTQTMYPLWAMNTLKVSVTSTLIGTLLCILSAYVLSRYRFKGRKAYMNLALVVTMFPSMIGMVAIYIILLNWGLLNNHLALILTYSTGPILGWVLVVKGFLDTFPKSLDESAYLDGAGNWMIFIKIFLPLCRPMIIFVSLMTFLGTVVDYIFPSLILTSTEKYTIAMGLYKMINDTIAGGARYTLFAAGSVLLAVPVTLLFLSMQNFLTQGLTAGSDKG